MVRGLSIVPFFKHNERFERQYRYEPPPGSLLTLPFSSCVHHLSSPDTLVLLKPLSITECTHTHIDVHVQKIHIHRYIHKCTKTQKKDRDTGTVCVLWWCCHSFSLSPFSFHFLSASDQHMCENKPQHTHMHSHNVCDRKPNTQKTRIVIWR